MKLKIIFRLSNRSKGTIQSIQVGQREGMMTMEKSLEELIGRGVISNAEKNS
jgi:Tfp pilus assembly pilus retraction ATPase PilT